MVAEELRLAASELGRITGTVDVEDVLDSYFPIFASASSDSSTPLIPRLSGMSVIITNRPSDVQHPTLIVWLESFSTAYVEEEVNFCRYRRLSKPSLPLMLCLLTRSSSMPSLCS